MDTFSPPGTRKSLRRAWPAVIGVILFASLMAFRHEVPSMWARAVIASGAFLALACGLFLSRKPAS